MSENFVSLDESEELPEVYKIIKRTNDTISDRRKFLKNAARTIAGMGGLAAFGATVARCTDDAEIDISANNSKKCTCHVVCKCNTVSGDKGTRKQDIWDDTICSCNSVCTCDTVCTCEGKGGGGGGGTYYYPN